MHIRRDSFLDTHPSTMVIKSKTITSVKENFRSLLDTLSNEFHFPNRSSKKRVIDVSWPQSVVKTVEFGSPIERPVKIQNQHERILGQQTGLPAAAASEPVEDLPSLNSDATATKQETLAVEEATNVTANPANSASLDEVRDVNVGNAQQDNRASINTTSVQEWMSEPRTSWRQSARRTKATVSKIRHMKPELRSLPHNNLRPDVAQHTLRETASNYIQPQADLSSNPPTQRRSSPTSATPQTGNNDSPSVRSTSSPPRREFVVPRAIAVKKDSWRYSVDAAVACNRERTQNRYSMPGDGFSDLLRGNEIRDSETLEKITKLRQEGLKRVTNTGDRPGVGSSNTDAETQQKISEIRQTTQHFHGARVRENNEANVVEGCGDTPAPPRDPVEPSSLDAPSEDSETVKIPTPSIPPPDSAHPPHAPETRPSTVSSNIRTPKAYVGLTHDIADRVQVQIYPRETKAESTERGRAAVLERWVDRELLRHRRQESRGVERKDEEGVIWRSADILLGKAKYAPGPAIVREFPLRESKPAPVPRGRPNGVGPSTDARSYKFPPPRLPRVPQNSPVESDFSDLISTARYPHRMPGSSQRFPPPPSRAIVSYSTSTSPDTQPSSRTVTPRMVNPSSYRQPGPWNIPDLANHPTTTPISASLAQELLFKYVRRPLHPIHSQNRHRRLAESQVFFTMEPPRNVYFNDLKNMVGYALEAQKAVQREGFTQEPTTLNLVNVLRLIISKEFLPYPLVCKDIFSTLQLFNCAWPVAVALGLRPFGLLHFMHEEVEILVFLSTEDEAMYLWSQGWDDGIFGARTLIRAGTTIDDCERGILNGLHVIGFEQGGWLKIEGYDDKTIEELNAETEEDLYGYVDWTKGLNVQM